MSYCRFEGTHAELRACINEVQDHVNEEAEYEISENEIRHFRQMVQEIVWFLQDSDLVDEYGDLDEKELDRVCEAMRNSYETEEEWCEYGE